MTELHIASWNVEGIGHYLGPDPARHELAEVVRALGDPDVICLQELRLRERDVADVRALEAALPRYTLARSLADDPRNARFRGGRTYGVGTFVRDSLSPIAIARPSWDREGRVAVVVLPEPKLAVVNVYAVNGTDKPYWSHEKGAFVGDRHGFKRAFHDRIAELGRALQAQGVSLVMIGDWNVSQAALDTTPRLRTEEPHATSRAHFRATVVEGLDLVDVFRLHHPKQRAYTWFRRHARALDAARVDFALVSRSLVPAVSAASIDDPRLGSDHAPLHVRITPSRA